VPELTGVVDEIAAAARRAARPVVLIDGGSGAGKSTLGALVAPRLGAQLLHLEDMYRGWDDLAGTSEQVYTLVLASATPGWRDWRWDRDEPGEWHPLDPALPLVVEGSGALSKRNRSAATLAIWIELDAITRQTRAIARDGERYAPHWHRWAAQEAAFAAREQPAALADIVLDAGSGDLTLRNF
jgi:cytidylate kinase